MLPERFPGGLQLLVESFLCLSGDLRRLGIPCVSEMSELLVDGSAPLV